MYNLYIEEKKKKDEEEKKRIAKSEERYKKRFNSKYQIKIIINIYRKYWNNV